MASTVDDIENSRYLSVDGMLQYTSMKCPLLPQESYYDQGEKCIGIWPHIVRIASVWAEVRTYVAKCANDQVKAPWCPDSDYVRINSHVLDMEIGFPPFYRYDAANFIDRDIEEISEKRQYWLPWMCVQINFHVIHTVMNHPFIYSWWGSKPQPGPSAFWRTSSELALLHSTWIARLIAMANKKGLELSDPFFAHAAAVAATIHSYWSRDTDSKVRATAVGYLEICVSFLAGIGMHWPFCRSIVSSKLQCRLPAGRPRFASC